MGALALGGSTRRTAQSWLKERQENEKNEKEQYLKFYVKRMRELKTETNWRGMESTQGWSECSSPLRWPHSSHACACVDVVLRSLRSHDE